MMTLATLRTLLLLLTLLALAPAAAAASDDDACRGDPSLVHACAWPAVESWAPPTCEDGAAQTRFRGASARVLDRAAGVFAGQWESCSPDSAGVSSFGRTGAYVSAGGYLLDVGVNRYHNERGYHTEEAFVVHGGAAAVTLLEVRSDEGTTCYATARVLFSGLVWREVPCAWRPLVALVP